MAVIFCSLSIVYDNTPCGPANLWLGYKPDTYKVTRYAWLWTSLIQGCSKSCAGITQTFFFAYICTFFFSFSPYLYNINVCKIVWLEFILLSLCSVDNHKGKKTYGIKWFFLSGDICVFFFDFFLLFRPCYFYNGWIETNINASFLSIMLYILLCTSK